MDCCSLSSTGLPDIDANNIIADKITILSNLLETFPYKYGGWYNIGDRFNKLFYVMSDTPHSIINYDATHNTVIRISEPGHSKPNILSTSGTISNISWNINFKI